MKILLRRRRGEDGAISFSFDEYGSILRGEMCDEQQWLQQTHRQFQSTVQNRFLSTKSNFGRLKFVFSAVIIPFIQYSNVAHTSFFLSHTEWQARPHGRPCILYGIWKHKSSHANAVHSNLITLLLAISCRDFVKSEEKRAIRFGFVFGFLLLESVFLVSKSIKKMTSMHCVSVCVNPHSRGVVAE